MLKWLEMQKNSNMTQISTNNSINVTILIRESFQSQTQKLAWEGSSQIVSQFRSSLDAGNELYNSWLQNSIFCPSEQT